MFKIKCYIFTILIILTALTASWWEELTVENTQEEKEEIEETEKKEKDSTAAKTDQQAEVNKNLEYAVTLIEAGLNKERGVVTVTWMDIENPAARYKIYRHNQPINSADILESARYLTTVGAGIQKYNDTLKSSGQYYYAVTAVVDNKEYKVFLQEQSFTTSPVIYKLKKEALHTSGLKVIYNQFLGSIFLRWNDPSTSKDFTVFVYRGQSTLDTLDKVKSSTLVSPVPKGEERYQDKTVKRNGTYYYATVIQLENRQTMEPVFIANQNYTTKPLDVSQKGEKLSFETLPLKTETEKQTDTAGKKNVSKKEQRPAQREPVKKAQHDFPHTYDLTITYNKKENYVSLKWQMSVSINKPFYINIYRSTNLIQNVLELTAPEKILESLPERSCYQNQKYEYRDYNIEANQDYYYAVMIDTGNGIEEQKLLLLDNYIKYPVRIHKNIKKTATQAAAEQIRTTNARETYNHKAMKNRIKDILIDYYKKEHYVYTIDKLKNILKNEILNNENKKIVLLFIGRSYLAENKFEQAMDYFYSLKKLDKPAGIFWLEKTIEKIN
ncbi:MAG TPA: hypothetical protein VKS21_04640 [Spirochaetota bacterium]|nr:hypothetical protein [Spirochaetota bacterium]